MDSKKDKITLLHRYSREMNPEVELSINAKDIMPINFNDLFT